MLMIAAMVRNRCTTWQAVVTPTFSGCTQLQHDGAAGSAAAAR